MYKFIPSNLDLDKIIVEHRAAFVIQKFDAANLYYIIQTVMFQSFKTDRLLHNDFLALSAKLLQIKIRNYKEYLVFLMNTGILISNYSYKPNKVSTGYKLAPNYQHQKVKYIEVIDKSFIKLMKSEAKLTLKKKTKFKHLLKWYNSELQFDVKLANDFIEADLARKLAYPSLRDYDAKNKRSKNPYDQYNSALINIERIKVGDYNISIDDNVHRLHSTISNFRSTLRNCFKYGDRNLTSVDIKNSQPYLSILLLNKSFWLNDNNGEILKIANINKDFTKFIFDNNKNFNSFIMLCKSNETQYSNDLQHFISLVVSGKLYEYLSEQIEQKFKVKITDRSKLKPIIFQVLFTDNRFLGQKDAQYKRLFKQLFPTVYNIFAIIKKKDKSMLPRLLQRIESCLILEVITKRIAKEKPSLPIFTIHDSIITLKGHEAYVSNVMKEELSKAIGFPPSLSTEMLDTKNLKFNDNTLFYGNNLFAA